MIRRGNRSTSFTLAVLLLLLTTLPRRCPAEFLYFVNGGAIQSPATVSGDHVLIETPVGNVPFHVKDFLKIVPGGCPDREWEARKQDALARGPEARFAATWWALENGLVSEAVSLIRSTRTADRDHRPTARLAAALDRLDRPCEDPDVAPLLRALGVSCSEARSPHVLLLHQHGDADASARLDQLERVVVAYYLSFAGQGIDVNVPGRRLVSVYLKDRGDYLSFLRSQNAGAFRSTLGYYHPTFRAVIAYDARSSGKSKANGPPLGPSNSEAAPDAPLPHDPRLSDIRRRRLLNDLDALHRDLGTASHEMVHLLVTESGLEPRPGAFPHWLHEGLAAQFEVFRGGRWSGIGRAHDLRLPDFRAVPPPLNLSGLVRDTGFGHGYRRDLYARSWSLVYFLRKTRPSEFREFLDLLRSPSPGTPPDDGTRFDTAFRASFGPDLASTETQWQSFMEPIQTPLEENAPGVFSRGRPFPADRD